ncbi:hypothetical protein [Rhizobacter sp. P5_C2]
MTNGRATAPPRRDVGPDGLQAVVDGSQRQEGRAQALWNEQLHASPRMALQRRQIADAFGSAAPPVADTKSNPVAQRELWTYDDIKKSAKTGRFSWQPLRSDISGGDSEKKGVAHGLGAELKDGKSELATKVTWTGTHKNGDGQKMVALPLGPDHKLGSEPVSGQQHVWNENRARLKRITDETYVAGHLLNNNLGGPGNDSRNLAAIPASINSLHSKMVEEKVKSSVNGKGRFIRYEVEIDQDTFKYRQENLSYASKITSRWSAVDNEGKPLPPVREVSIPISSPVPTKKKLDGVSDNRMKIDKSNGAKALFDVKTQIVLSNEGYLRVAKNVQQIFQEAIGDSELALEKTRGDLKAACAHAEDLDGQLKALTQSKEDSEGKNRESVGKLSGELKHARDDVAEYEGKLQGIANQMEKTQLQLKEAQDELSEKIIQLQLSQHENIGLVKDNSMLSHDLDGVRDELKKSQERNLALMKRNEILFARSDDLIDISDNSFGKLDRGTKTESGHLLVSPQRESDESNRRRFEIIRHQHEQEKLAPSSSGDKTALPSNKEGQ